MNVTLHFHFGSFDWTPLYIGRPAQRTGQEARCLTAFRVLLPGGPLRMAKKQSPKRGRRAPKTVPRLPDLDQAKSAVLNSPSSTDAQRGYRHAMDEFIDWYCSEPRLSFSKTIVL